MQAICAVCGFIVVTTDDAAITVRHLVDDGGTYHEIALMDPIPVTVLSSTCEVFPMRRVSAKVENG